MEIVKKMFIFDLIITVLSMILIVISPPIMIHGIKLTGSILFGSIYINLKIKRKKIKEYYYNYYKNKGMTELAYKWSIVFSYITLLVSIAFLVKFIAELI